MKKCILIVGLLIVAGGASTAAKWENAGTLVSVSPAEGPTRSPGRLGTALGDDKLGRTRIETKFELRDGTPVLVRLPELNFLDDKAGKPMKVAAMFRTWYTPAEVCLTMALW